MALANVEAQRMNHEYIGPEHVILGLVKEGGGEAAKLLGDNDIDLRKVRLEVEKQLAQGQSQITMGKLPQDAGARALIKHACDIADKLEVRGVGTGNLLYGMGKMPDSVPARVLTSLGFNFDVIEDGLRESYAAERYVKGLGEDVKKLGFVAFKEIVKAGGIIPVGKLPSSEGEKGLISYDVNSPYKASYALDLAGFFDGRNIEYVEEPSREELKTRMGEMRDDASDLLARLDSSES